MKTSDILRNARKILKRDGWIKGDFHRHGSHCALGAIQRACEEGGLSGTSTEYYSAVNVLEPLTPMGSVASWNDAGATKEEEVHDTFAKAVNKAVASELEVA